MDAMTWHERSLAFDAAIRANPYVMPYLLDPDSMPFDQSPHFALRSREEVA